MKRPILRNRQNRRWARQLRRGTRAPIMADPTIQLSHTQASSVADLQNKMTSVNGGTLITFDPTHSIQINGVAPTGLRANNFVIL